MLLTITTTREPATDLGFLLGKHPARGQVFPLAFGQARVFYPEASPTRCSATLLLEIDPIGLVRRGPGVWSLDQYVNDRPYTASSFLSVAIAEVYKSALNGRPAASRPGLAETPLPLTARLSAVASRGGESLLRRLFEPLGYAVSVIGAPLDPTFPEWGDSPFFTVELSATTRLQDLLTHLYTLIPVLDNAKHYWVGDDEVEKLLRRGEGWLNQHPERELITQRYLRRRRRLVREALARLIVEDDPATASVDDEPPPVGDDAPVGAAVTASAGPPAAPSADGATTRQPTLARLHAQRLDAVLAALKAVEARRVLDLGCGEGRLLERLLADPQFTAIVGVDVALRSLEIARDRLRLDRLAESTRARIQLLHGSLTYRDKRLADFDAAAVVEVVEHLDPARLAAFERVVFEHARPRSVVLTTPNREYNALFEDFAPGKLRHPDHRFEWTRAEFADWAARVAARHNYSVTIEPVGPVDPTWGAPSQLGLFRQN